ncbi:NAD-dependent epimerase/dehydratase family protein [Xinfangfangia sp. CPCC 101601]|uniref:NAD-dependent epimerase/dehydratase family protein n=1 Tax=Pseudogemmobacter lacusdianii TaxID=3069608 RepID=A0ABU0W1F5_9RHOB|nr:NAD-dependent epimerase/dehydratase family protein [Xinfangfangia sp. CPCC 101601]MDQ2067833.1 NAD-dependent epimerase/dehydratase family protein [Xinfangfangia sp. CPCC 101601]
MSGRILITGATGFLGTTLRRALHDRDVIAQSRDPARLEALPEPGLAWDLAEPLPDTQSLQGVETILHCAALSAPFGHLHDFRRANVAATALVIALARRLGVRRLVHISSPSVLFAPCDQLDLDETTPLPAPYTSYARTKAEAEALVLAAPDLSPVILRPRGLYGAGDTALLPRLLQAARSRPLPLFRGGHARIDLTHVDDVATACIAALDAGPEASGQIFHISGGTSLPVTEIASRACARVNVALRWRKMPLPPVLFAASIAERMALLTHGREPMVTRYGLALFAYAQSLNIGKAEKILGWRPRISFDEGLDRTFKARP